MTFVNAALSLIIVLMLLIIVLLVDLKRLTEVLLDRSTHIDNMVTEQRARQHRVASKEGPSPAPAERVKVKQRYQVPGTAKITSAVKLVRKGGYDRADTENNRLRSDPDQVHEAKRTTRWVGGTQAPE